MPDQPIPAPVVRLLTALLALTALVGFVLIFGKAILDVFGADAGQPPTQADSFLYVATAAATLVGGIVAVGFGVELPPDENLTGTSRLQTSQTALGSVAWPWNQAARPAMGAIYAVAYMVIGAAAVVTWVVHPNETSELVKNLATTVVALVVPIVNGYFRPNA